MTLGTSNIISLRSGLLVLISLHPLV